MSKVLLDTSAVLAFLFDEEGADVVSPVLNAGLGVMSTVNHAELVSKLIDVKMPIKIICETVSNLEIDLVPFSEHHAFKSGELRDFSKQYGLSLGDRACLAVASIEGFSVLTADRVWREMPDEFQVKVIR